MGVVVVSIGVVPVSMGIVVVSIVVVVVSLAFVVVSIAAVVVVAALAGGMCSSLILSACIFQATFDIWQRLHMGNFTCI